MISLYKNNNVIAKPCVLALGNFDGVHLAHTALLDVARDFANKKDIDFGIYTFEAHSKSEKELLTTNDEKLSLFLQCGADFVYFEDFESVKNMSPREFVQYICNKFGVVCAVCGQDFRFGKKASGDCNVLEEQMKAHENDCIVVETVSIGEKPVSSTEIRKALKVGETQKAKELLGYFYGFSNEVIHGASLGNALGFPTINQKIPNGKLCPMYGVYASRVTVEGVTRYGVTNVGIKPTVTDVGEPLAETYIIDFDGDIYGKTAHLELVKLLRPEKKFSSLDELIENIKQNVVQTKKYFEENDT